ncbi:hypothetical protein Ais01nite_02580 [Asanoa ishikariensis]|nr:hypothetical protein [Asanoa ishikariensis]GIF62223.1 hypothetical protein Ais01nite_02580 [Asanoa ishikariensis]
MRRWRMPFAGGLLVAGLGAFLAVQSLDKADKWASVLGLFVGLAGLVLTAVGAIGARRRAGGQSVTDAAIGGGVAQVRGVRGSVRIGPGAPPSAVPPPPAASSPSPAPASPPGDGDGGQSLTRSSTAGPVRQVDDVSGDVEVDR